MSSLGKHSINKNTPGNVLLGAGTYHKGLHFDVDAGKFVGTRIGATNSGGKVSIKGEFLDLELDGALVKFKGQTVKVGGTANIEANFAEASTDVLKMSTLFKEGESEATGYTMLVDKPNIEEGDYIEGFGFVGKTADGSKDIVVIFEHGLCISGLELEGKNKEQSIIKLSIDAYAENDGDLDTLPVKIYYPELATE